MAQKTLKRNPKLFGRKGAKAPKVEAPSAAEVSLLSICQPLENRVVIEIDAAEKRIGNIVLPDSATDKPQTGKVIKIGPGRFRDGVHVPCTVVEGDRVIFAKYAGMSLEGAALKDGDKYIMLRDDDILAKIPNRA